MIKPGLPKTKSFASPGSTHTRRTSRRALGQRLQSLGMGGVWLLVRFMQFRILGFRVLLGS